MPGNRRREEETNRANGVEEVEKEYQVDDLRDRIRSSRGSTINLIQNELGLDRNRRRIYSRESVIYGLKDLSNGMVIHPDNRLYQVWVKFILLWAVYSSFFTPLEFGFFRGLPEKFFVLDIIGQVAFLFDIALQFFIAYRDSHYKMIYKRIPITLRYLQSSFFIDLLACMPWDMIYKACGEREGVRYLLWIRLCRVRKVTDFVQKMEKDIRINYLFTRIVKLIVVELYCTHTAACIFYYLATTLPPDQEGYTWIGSLKLGDYSYSHFREIDLWKRYITSLYFAIVTMATVGYGEIHAVNIREMIFIMIYVSFDMILGAYLIGNMTALIVKGSKTEKFRDKMTDLMKYMNRNRLGRDVRDQIKGHLRLQYESSYTEASVLQDIPISIRAKISQTLYKSYIENVPLFKECSTEFINQIEEVGIGADGSEDTFSLLEPDSSFGAISIICNIPLPYTVRVCELCRLLRIDKQSFSNILDIYFHDGRRILNNLLEGKESNIRLKQLGSDIAFHIGKQEAELALKVNSAVYHGDLRQLKCLIRAGADPNKADYDGRSPLHLSASKGYEDITLFLIQEGVDINISDNFGNTPLIEALKNGHDRVASLLVKEKASLGMDNAGGFLCTLVAKGDSDFLRRILSNGIDPNSKDYDHRTPLHVAASEGLYLMAKMLLDAGASVFAKDRRGNTPLDEAQMCGNNNLIKLLEEAKATQLSEFPGCSQKFTDKVHLRKCTVFPFHPWCPKDPKKHGIVLWVPHTIEELIKEAAEQLDFPFDSCILLSEEAGKILDVDMISDGQRLHLINPAH
ncbi:potassium channel SKOR-like isoform X2 [Diospyros lotus]|uniref:potassium channel SKOR-like isoform X2 n=1 Tax=Diospyros lotus TaxID=55363 RepID=UPI00225C25B6|nr:potassium channel SKOR-like isoform X2 [Diospyros lotus]